MYAQNYNNLKNMKIKKSGPKHNINENSNVVPFTTGSVEQLKFKNGFSPIVGALSRIVCNKDKKIIGDEEFTDSIFNNEFLECDNDCYNVFESLISGYFDNSDIDNLIHPKLLLFLNLCEADGPRKGEIKTAKFLNQVFFKNIDFKNFFEDGISKDSNILVQFITENLMDFDEKEEKMPEYEVPESLKGIIEVFEEDFNFLLKHKSFLLENIELFLAYYYFFYMTQFALKLDSNKCLNEVVELYWLLDWESMSKNRISYKRGFNKIDAAFNNFLSNVNAMEHLNILFESDENNLLPSDIIEKFKDLDETNQNEFLKYLKIWINEWRTENKLEKVEVDDLNIVELVTILKEIFPESIKRGSHTRFRDNVKQLGNQYFLKGRGRYRTMLNMNQELLLLITAISIKKDKLKSDKIILTDLFKEYERRGIYFDRDSRDEIVVLFNRLNLIDKKSDSGEVEYVKSIL